MADSTNVIPADFGKEYNESARRLARLMALADEQAAQLAADPKVFLNQAADRIVMLQREMRRMATAMRKPLILALPDDRPPAMSARDIVRVEDADYRRWKAGEEIARDWIVRGLA